MVELVTKITNSHVPNANHDPIIPIRYALHKPLDNLWIISSNYTPFNCLEQSNPVSSRDEGEDKQYVDECDNPKTYSTRLG